MPACLTQLWLVGLRLLETCNYSTTATGHPGSACLSSVSLKKAPSSTTPNLIAAIRLIRLSHHHLPLPLYPASSPPLLSHSVTTKYHLHVQPIAYQDLLHFHQSSLQRGSSAAERPSSRRSAGKGDRSSTTMLEPKYYASSSPTFTKAKIPFSWPSIPNPIPRRYRRRLRSKFRSAQSPASSIASIETSFNPSDTIRALRSHRWSYYDGQYIILIILAIFSLSISQAPGPLIKTGAATLLILALLVPVTRQFFLPVLPIFTWLLFFFNARYVAHFLILAEE